MLSEELQDVQIEVFIFRLHIRNSIQCRSFKILPFEKTIGELNDEAPFGEKYASLRLRCEAFTTLTLEALKAKNAPYASLEKSIPLLRNEARNMLLVSKLLDLDLNGLEPNETFKISLLREVDRDLDQLYKGHTNKYNKMSQDAGKIENSGGSFDSLEQKKLQEDLANCGSISQVGIYVSKNLGDLFDETFETALNVKKKTASFTEFIQKHYPFEHTLSQIEAQEIGDVIGTSTNRCLGLYHAITNGDISGVEEEDYEKNLSVMKSLKLLLESKRLKESAGLSNEEAIAVAYKRVNTTIDEYAPLYIEWRKVIKERVEDSFSFTLLYNDEPSCGSMVRSFLELQSE